MAQQTRQKIFGFEIEAQNKKNSLESPVEVHDENGMPVGGAFTVGHLVEHRFKSESELIQVYRDIALHSEVDYAIDEIVNEAFVYDGHSDPVSIELGKTGLDAQMQRKIRDEFHNILRLLSFKSNVYEIFRRWYIDGRLYFNVIIDEKRPKDGIKEIRFIDPLQIKHVKTPEYKQDENGNIVYSQDGVKEHYEYYPLGAANANSKQNILLAKDSVIYVPSGLYDRSRGIVLSYLDKTIKPLNSLRSLEDSTVIHTLARAPMRRAFYIDVDGMSLPKAEQYMRETMARYRNKVEYDSKTGMVMNNRSYQAMLEDYWLPRREGKNTEIDTIEGSGSLLDMENVQYYKRNLYQSLNVPTSRLEPDQQVSWGRDAEINREELKFSKFIIRLRHSFTKLFDDLLRVQLSSKGIVSVSDWKNLSSDIHYLWESELHYHEMQKLDILQRRIDVLEAIKEYSGEYYSENYIKTSVLGQTEQDQKDMKKEMKKEAKAQEDEIDDMDDGSFEFDEPEDDNTKDEKPKDEPDDQAKDNDAEGEESLDDDYSLITSSLVDEDEKSTLLETLNNYKFD